jgi:hypothetical protein
VKLEPVLAANPIDLSIAPLAESLERDQISEIQRRQDGR